MADSVSMDQAADHLQAILARQRQSFLADMPVSLASRQDRLDRGIAMLLHHRQALHDALMSDFPVRGESWTWLAEIFASVNALQTTRKQFHRWLKPERRSAPMPFNLFGARAEIQYQPLGVIGIMGAWNGVVTLVMAPLAPAFAAGNRAMLCPSDLMPATAQVLAEAAQSYFDETELYVARGGLGVSQAFASLPFDHLLFTGSPAVGAKVMAAAAPNLVPVTLELGGKCPVIVAPDADLADAAKSIIGAKTMNGGQACLAPDLLLCPRDRVAEFVKALDQAAETLYPGAAGHADYCGIVNERHFQRVESLLDQARESGADIRPLGISGGAESERRDAAQRKLALHVVVEPAADSRAMREEVFGPVMTLLPYDDLEQACSRLRQMPKPLGLYIYARANKIVQRVLDQSFSGGVTVNDSMFHYSVADMPFGGVGQSGMGSYSAGIDGFRRFSHARSIYRQAGPRALMSVMHPPYGRLFNWAIRNRLEKMARKALPPSRGKA